MISNQYKLDQWYFHEYNTLLTKGSADIATYKLISNLNLDSETLIVWKLEIFPRVYWPDGVPNYH